MQKYQKYFQEMVSQNQDLFKKFKIVHDNYAMDQEKYRKEFNETGSEITDIIRTWESRLCGKSEGGGYGKFSGNLADKFWGEIRKNFHYIDLVGCN